MPFDGSGNFNRDHTWASDAAAGIKIKADIHDTHDNDLANALSLTLLKDGQSSPTEDINWGGKKITNLASGAAATDAATVGQVNAIRTFPSSISITGSFPESVIKYTGNTGAWGSSYTMINTPDGLSDGVSTTGEWVWNTKADFTGTNAMKLTKDGNLSLLSKIDTASVGPVLQLIRESPSPADADAVGQIQFQARNSLAVTKTYADIYAKLDDVTSATEDASISIRAMQAGALSTAVLITPATTTIYSALNTSGNVGVTGAITASGSLTANGVLAGAGLRSRSGTSGGYVSNWMNFHWNGGYVGLYVDNTYLGNIAFVSDYRIKKDVEDLGSTWDTVKALRPIRYTQAEFDIFRSSDEPQWGFIAHELQETLLPTAAQGTKDMEGGVQSLNWPPIVAALTKALQEAMARIEVLEAKA